MGTFFWLATEAAASAESAAEHGFGLNFDILETNVINLIIIAIVLVNFGSKFLGKILSERRSAIETAIQEAEKRKQDAAAALATQQQKLAQAKSEAERIRAQAEDNAKVAKQAILDQAARDVERLREAAAQDTNTEQDRVINELRQRVAALALQKVESDLGSRMNDSLQQQLIDRSLTMLGGR